MDPINASNADELAGVVASIDIAVPLRTEGRTTDHCERWSVCRLLATIADSGCLDYPITLIHRDRPDFQIQHGSKDCGVEVTEVIPENYAAIDAYREHHQVEGPFFLNRHAPGDARLKGAELRSAATSSESGDGWGGDSVEREWVAAMLAFISAKVEKTKKPGFQLFPENWLLMYDNWSLPGVDREDAAARLSASLQLDHFGPFNKIWVESSDTIWCFSSFGVIPHEIRDLWAEANNSLQRTFDPQPILLLQNGSRLKRR